MNKKKKIVRIADFALALGIGLVVGGVIKADGGTWTGSLFAVLVVWLTVFITLPRIK